jgi:hypothetical protein
MPRQAGFSPTLSVGTRRQLATEQPTTATASRMRLTVDARGRRVVELSGGNQQKVILARWLLVPTRNSAWEESLCTRVVAFERASVSSLRPPVQVQPGEEFPTRWIRFKRPDAGRSRRDTLNIMTPRLAGPGFVPASGPAACRANPGTAVPDPTRVCAAHVGSEPTAIRQNMPRNSPQPRINETDTRFRPIGFGARASQRADRPYRTATPARGPRRPAPWGRQIPRAYLRIRILPMKWDAERFCVKVFPLRHRKTERAVC